LDVVVPVLPAVAILSNWQERPVPSLTTLCNALVRREAVLFLTALWDEPGFSNRTFPS